MRDLTFTELDTEIAEQLPARELMGKGWCGCGGGDSFNQWNGSANGNTGGGGFNVGILNGNLSGNNVAILGGGGPVR
jgi:hypothetical protein